MKNIGIVGYVDHGKTTVTSAITKVLQARVEGVTVIEQSFERERGVKITNPYIFEDLVLGDLRDGKHKRRERRKNQRKSK